LAGIYIEIMKKILLLLLMMGLCAPVPAQRAKTRQKTQQVKKTPQKKRQTERQRLEAQKKQVQQQQAKARKRQRDLENKVRTGLENVQILGSEIKDKQTLVDSLKKDIAVLDGRIVVLNGQLDTLKQQLKERKDLYMKSVRDMFRNRKAQNRLLFVFSAKNFNQMYRRLRYTDEYSSYQKAQGEAVKQKAEQVEQKQRELTAARDEQAKLLAKSVSEQQAIEKKQADEKVLVASLQKEQRTVQKLIRQQQDEERALNARIERAIQAEIARAAEEARRRAEAEAQRKAKAQQKDLAEKTDKKVKGKKKSTKEKKADNAKKEYFEMPAADRALSGSFESNKGKLPVPITGGYSLIRGLGLYTVVGMKGVTLESKGLYFKGQDGAQARCVFDGQVTAVVQRGNTYVVMVRHGKYISVYCNLASVSVSSKQMVKTNQILGRLGNDHVLQFQLRNWTQILDPRPWLYR